MVAVTLMGACNSAVNAQDGATAPTVDHAADDAALPYTPQDGDERGLWMKVEEAERELKTSKFVIEDRALNDYVRSVLCRTVGAVQCGQTRIYIMRTPYFNASMAPNGMMQVWSGLLLRVQNEAQLAAILAHEYGHYKARHTIRLFRSIREKTNAASWLGFLPFGWMAQYGLVYSIFSFSRDMERDADYGSIDYLSNAGYDPMAASTIWERLRAEMDATAAARSTKSRKDKNGGLFATHPPTAERMTTLRQLAEARGGGERALRADEFHAAMANHWADFVDDQLKLNDFGGSDFLLNSLASDGWTAPLLYARGELYRRRAGPGDLDAAIGYYRAALGRDGNYPELYRGLGLALIKKGEGNDGRAQLQEYLKRAPNAMDRAVMAILAGASE